MKSEQLDQFKRMEDGALTKVKISEIVTAENVRTNKTDPGIASLMQSIKHTRLFQPIGLSLTQAGELVLLYGWRRLAACQKLSYDTIDARIFKEVEGKELIAANIIENVQRKDISTAELGRMCVKLRKEYEMTDSEIAAAISVTLNRVKNSMNLFLNVSPEEAKRIRRVGGREHKAGDMAETTARRVLGVSKKYGMTKAVQNKLLHKARVEEMSVETISLVSKFLEKGASVTQARLQAKKMGAYSTLVFANREEVEELARKARVSVRQLLVKIIYGEHPPLKRPKLLV